MSNRPSNAKLGLLVAALMIALTIVAVIYRAYGGHAPIVPTASPAPASLAPAKSR